MNHVEKNGAQTSLKPLDVAASQFFSLLLALSLGTFRQNLFTPGLPGSFCPSNVKGHQPDCTQTRPRRARGAWSRRGGELLCVSICFKREDEVLTAFGKELSTVVLSTISRMRLRWLSLERPSFLRRSRTAMALFPAVTHQHLPGPWDRPSAAQSRWRKRGFPNLMSEPLWETPLEMRLEAAHWSKLSEGQWPRRQPRRRYLQPNENEGGRTLPEPLPADQT